MFRYVAILWDTRNISEFEAASQLASRVKKSHLNLDRTTDEPGLRVFASPEHQALIHRLPEGHGVILGSLFVKPDIDEIRTHARTAPDARRQEAQVDRATSSEIVRTKGRALISKFWGRYVAFIRAANCTTYVVKDPTGCLPCFMARIDGVTVVFSSVTDCIALGLTFSINDDYIKARVALGAAYMREAGLADVRELHGGECIGIGPAAQRPTFYWNPFTVATERTIEDFDEARAMLRAVTKYSIHCWASQHEQILHQLSGGLDSSIVLGCLSDAPTSPRVSCITYYLPHGNSDERPFARAAAKRAGVAHIEYPRDPRSVDFENLLRSSPSVTPSSDCAYLEVGQVERKLAAELGATTVFNGEGGDSVFGAITKEHALTDYARRHGLSRKLARLATELAPILDQSIWRLLTGALRSVLNPTPWDPMANVLPDGPSLVSEAALSCARGMRTFPHPWFDLQEDAPAGLVLPILALALPRAYYDPMVPPQGAAPEPVASLFSQPLVELCLQIPSYIHAYGGRDRSVARAAFMPDVPNEILERQWKDRAAGSAEAILAQNIRFARELLLDGILVRDGLLDRTRLEEALSVKPGRDRIYALEIFDHLITESWLRLWGSVRQRAAA